MERETLTQRGEYANAYMPPERCLHGQQRPGELRQLCDHRVSFSPRLHIAALLVFAPRLVICISYPSNAVLLGAFIYVQMHVICVRCGCLGGSSPRPISELDVCHWSDILRLCACV